MHVKFLKNKYVVAAAVAVIVTVIVWFVWRDYNTRQSEQDLNILMSELERYQGKPQWDDAKNWDGYRAGDALPDAVK